MARSRVRDIFAEGGTIIRIRAYLIYKDRTRFFGSNVLSSP